MKIFAIALSASLAATAGASAPASAEADTASSNHTCIQGSEIDHTSITDNQTVLFHMRDGRVWKNVLRRECPGLKFEGGFSETISGSEVCSNAQVIYVLRTGTPCWLGEFTLYSKPGAD